AEEVSASGGSDDKRDPVAWRGLSNDGCLQFPARLTAPAAIAIAKTDSRNGSDDALRRPVGQPRSGSSCMEFQFPPPTLPRIETDFRQSVAMGLLAHSLISSLSDGKDTLRYLLNRRLPVNQWLELLKPVPA